MIGFIFVCKYYDIVGCIIIRGVIISSIVNDNIEIVVVFFVNRVYNI